MQQTFIMLSGFSRSGKSTLAKKIIDLFPDRFTKIDSDTIHSFLNTAYPVFKDDNTVDGKSYELRQKATKTMHNALVGVLLAEGHSILLDACNLLREKRQGILDKITAVNSDIVSIIIYNKISEEQLYKNLRKDDQALAEKGEKPAWVDLYEKIQKPKFEMPNANEVKHLLVYTEENTKSFFDELKKCLK